MTPELLMSGPPQAPATLVLAHGAGAGMTSPNMAAMADALADKGVRIARFEFAYMAARRSGGSRKPPPKAEILRDEYLAVTRALSHTGRLIIGGKSMGGRVASMIADDLYGTGDIAGLLCLGYPFHPVGKPDKLRTDHLLDLKTPTLICQGTRDSFGTREEVESYPLSDSIRVHWFEDGDHDLKPRKRVTGHSHGAYIAAMAAIVADWIAGL